MARSVVCISRAFGAGGEDVGWAVAKRLGFLYVDEDVIARAAARGGVDIERVADEERRRSLLAGLLDHLAAGGGDIGVAPLPVVNEPRAESVRGFIRDAVQEIAGRGEAVIVAHAASFVVGPGPHALRVLITAPQETRAKRIVAAEGIGEQEAAKVVRESDRDRVDYLKRFYSIAEELPTHYDLIVNTDTISVDDAAELIVEAALGGAEDAVGSLS